MALPPSNTIGKNSTTPEDPFLREVDEGVRRDQLTSFWKRWGIALVGAVVLLLGALGGWLWWQDQQVKNAGIAGEEFATALDKISVGDNAAARPVLEKLAAEGPGAYAPLARFMQAADQMAVGENEKAATMLQALVDDADLEPVLRDAARVRLARLRFDAMTPPQVVAMLKPLAVPGNPWFGLAGEMTALAHIKAGTPEPAKPLLIAIVKDDALPPSLRNRAAQLAQGLGIDEAALGLNPGLDQPATPTEPPAQPEAN
ncbi:hypothetical protein GCM10007973_13090 [Polymorphobacter multimanifer]|uniref:tetratricopeptide repeat protein n=1 Tax=Polymorphobacter multimanifer TaxID=1070431 RepID=UPI00166DCC67|nr:tetratricopeptide repeat protein [Polymorphobacter multimanifer]GGI77652.1 hypothetical protein GCM10007973_13090 [Polymorphobacter multimanifer]